MSYSQIQGTCSPKNVVFEDGQSHSGGRRYFDDYNYIWICYWSWVSHSQGWFFNGRTDFGMKCCPTSLISHNFVTQSDVILVILFNQKVHSLWTQWHQVCYAVLVILAVMSCICLDFRFSDLFELFEWVDRDVLILTQSAAGARIPSLSKTLPNHKLLSLWENLLHLSTECFISGQDPVFFVVGDPSIIWKVPGVPPWCPNLPSKECQSPWGVPVPPVVCRPWLAFYVHLFLCNFAWSKVEDNICQSRRKKRINSTMCLHGSSQ